MLLHPATEGAEHDQEHGKKIAWWEGPPPWCLALMLALVFGMATMTLSATGSNFLLGKANVAGVGTEPSQHQKHQCCGYCSKPSVCSHYGSLLLHTEASEQAP